MFTSRLNMTLLPLTLGLIWGLLGCESGFKTSVTTNQAKEQYERTKDRFTFSEFDSGGEASFEFPGALGSILIEAQSFERSISLGLSSESFGRVVRFEVQSFFLDNGLMTKEELKKGLKLVMSVLPQTNVEAIKLEISLDYGKSFQNYSFDPNQIASEGDQKKLHMIVHEPIFIMRGTFPEVLSPKTTEQATVPDSDTSDPSGNTKASNEDHSSETSNNSDPNPSDTFAVTLEMESFSLNEDESFSKKIYSAESNPEATRVFLKSFPKKGSATLEGEILSYTPGKDYYGSDSLSLLFLNKTGDALEKTLSITVNSINDSPLIKTTEISTQENQPVTFEISTTDIDSSNLTYQIQSAPQNGSVALTETALKASGSYTPSNDFNGADNFTISATDDEGAVGLITVEVSIAEINSPPELSVIVASNGNPPPTTSDVYFLKPGTLFSIISTVTDSDSILAKMDSCDIYTPALATTHKNHIAEENAIACDALLGKASDSEVYPSTTSQVSGLNTKNTTFTWMPSIGQEGTYDLRFIASDEDSSDTLIIRLYVSNQPMDLTVLTGNTSGFANSTDSNNEAKKWLGHSISSEARSVKGLNDPSFSLVPSAWVGNFTSGDGSLSNPIGIFSIDTSNSLQPSRIDTSANAYGFHLKLDGQGNDNHGKVVFENDGASNPVTVKRIGNAGFVSYQLSPKGTKTYAEYTMDLNPTLYLRFEDSIEKSVFRDLTGNGYYGVTRTDVGTSNVLPKTGATTLSRLSQGSHTSLTGLGSYLQLNGNSDDTFMEIPYGQLQPPFTIEFFFKPEVFNWDTILGKPMQSNSNGSLLIQYANSSSSGRTSDRLNFCIRDNTASPICSVSDDGVAKAAGTWYHGVFIHDGSEMRMFIDGILQASRPSATLPLAAQSGNFISGEWYNNAPNQIFQGSLDEFAIYPRALTATEISDHFALATVNQYCTQTATNSAPIHDLFIEINPTASTLSVASESSCSLNLASQVEEDSVYILNNSAKNNGFAGKLISYSQFEADTTGGESIPGSSFVSQLRLNSLLSTRTASDQVVLDKYRPILNLNAADAGFKWQSPADDACNYYGLSFWDDYFAAGNAILMGYEDSCSATSGWAGTGIDANPYLLQFDGVDDEVFYPLTDSQFSENISIGVWFKLDTLTDYARVFSIGSGQQDIINFVPQHGVAPKRPAVRFVSSSLDQVERLDTTFVTDQWYHVVFVMDHIENKAYVYLNGAEDISFTRPVGYRLGQIDIDYARLSGSYWVGDPVFDGAISNFVIFDEALSVSEVRALCVATKPISTLDCNE